jgi:hypothetical protein
VGTAITPLILRAGPTEFYRSYLWSFMFIGRLTIGSLAWLMLQLLPAALGPVFRRSCEAAPAPAAGARDVSPHRDRHQ